MTKRKIADTPIDPTLPNTPIEIDGKKLDLCFDLGALAEAEDHFLREGKDVNILTALPRLNLSNVRVLFAASLRKFHPEYTFDAAVKLVTLANLYLITNLIQQAWQDAMPEAEVTLKGEETPA